MPKLPHVPQYRLHKTSGQARVILDGRHIYLGPYGSPESRTAYARLLAERFSPKLAESTRPQPPDVVDQLSINELLVRYLQFAERYYVKDGQPTKELTSMKEALGPLRHLYGTDLAATFGPLKLKAVREEMIRRDLSRRLINQRINRIKRVLKWAVSEELLAPAVFEAARTVAALRYGRCDVREAPPVRPVDDIWVDAVLPYVAPQVAAMITLQRLTGMRPGEVVTMRPADLDMSQDIWIYEQPEHKTRWRDHRRRVPLGPKAQAVLQPYLNRGVEEYLFSPREAEDARNEQRAIRRNPNRKTKIYPSELRARERRKQLARRRKPKRPKGVRYTPDSYRQAIEYGIVRANRERQKVDPQAAMVPHWFPYQIRHRMSTDIRKEFGVEAAQVVLGHARTNIVDIYAEKNFGLAVSLARKIG